MLLNKIKNSLRVSGIDFLEEEIKDLIDAAKSDLELSGIKRNKIIDDNPLIIRAITSYCKANFGYDNQEAERFQNSYECIKNHMALSVYYNSEE